MSAAISAWVDSLVLDHIRSEWFNHRRAINEPQAREDFLIGAKLYVYEHGSTKPVNLYADAERLTPLPNPTFFDSRGLIGPCFMPVDGCDLRLVRHDDIFISDCRFSTAETAQS